MLCDRESPKSKVKRLRQEIRNTELQWMNDQDNVFFWINTFPKEICHYICSFITSPIKKTIRKKLNVDGHDTYEYVSDPNQLMNIGLVCKMWWRGPPPNAWYRTQKDPFCILSYMRYKFRPNIPINPILKIQDTGNNRLFHFEGLQPGKWGYKLKDTSWGPHYIMIGGHAKIFVRPLVPGLSFQVIYPWITDANERIEWIGDPPSSTSSKHNLSPIGHIYELSFSKISGRFRLQKWTTPKPIIIRAVLSKGTSYQAIHFCVRIMQRTQMQRIQQKIKEKKPIYTMTLI